MAVVQSIVERVIGEVGGARVLAVRLSVGELCGVVPAALRFCFDVIAEGTVLAGAELQIDEPAGTAHCSSCDGDFRMVDLVLLCPCGSPNVTVRTGRELTIRSVTVA